jgi:CheY-like chemotaxis protein
MDRSPKTRGRIAVLVVDDEPLVRLDVASILQQAGFDVEEASDSDEALRKPNGGGLRLGALVTDVQMPGAMNGYALAKRVHHLFPQAAIVVISGVVRPSQATCHRMLSSWQSRSARNASFAPSMMRSPGFVSGQNGNCTLLNGTIV